MRRFIWKHVSFLIATWRSRVHHFQTRLIPNCDMTTSCVHCGFFICVSWLLGSCPFLIPSSLLHNSFMCVCDMTPFICVSHITHIWMSRVTHITHSMQYVVFYFRISEKHNPHISGGHSVLFRNSNLVSSKYTLTVHGFILRYSDRVMRFRFIHSV